MGIFAKPSTLKFDSWFYSNILQNFYIFTIEVWFSETAIMNCDLIMNISIIWNPHKKSHKLMQIWIFMSSFSSTLENQKSVI